MEIITIILTFVLVIIIFISIITKLSAIYKKFKDSTINEGLEIQEFNFTPFVNFGSTSGIAGSVGIKKKKKVSHKRIIRKTNFKKNKRFIKSRIESLRLKGTKRVSTGDKKSW